MSEKLLQWVTNGMNNQTFLPSKIVDQDQCILNVRGPY